MECVDLSESRLEEKGTHIEHERARERGFSCGSKQGRSQVPGPGPLAVTVLEHATPWVNLGEVTPRAQGAAASVLLIFPVSSFSCSPEGSFLLPWAELTTQAFCA